MCVAATLCVFFLPARQMFLVHTLAVSVFFLGVGLLSLRRAWQGKNIGDAIIAFAALLVITGLPMSAYLLQSGGEMVSSQALLFGFYSAAYALVVVGFLASVLIEYQQHLAHLATEDPLTRLLNRRGLEDALQLSMAAAARHGHSTAVIMADIDHFKSVNDSFGHELGDHVIQQVARILDRMCRASDVVARTGGEEFLIVLPNTQLEAARALAERIRQTIGDHPLLVDQQRIPVTVSLGVAATTGEVDLDSLYDEADRAMYIAKRGGRNRVASVDSKPMQLSGAKA
jgi:diguanylate cyclase (GGDEF)-like protein